MTRNQLLTLLSLVQNSAEYEMVDIMTFAGFCRGDELKTYVFDRWLSLKDTGRKVAILRQARLIAGPIAA